MTVLLLFVWWFHLPSSLWASWWASIKVLLCVERLIKGQVPMHGMKLSLFLIELSCKRNLEIYQGCHNTGGSLMQAHKTSFKGLLWIYHTGNCFLTEVLEKSSSKRWGYTLASLPRMTLPLLDHLQNPDHCQAKHKYLWPLFPLSNCAPNMQNKLLELINITCLHIDLVFLWDKGRVYLFVVWAPNRLLGACVCAQSPRRVQLFVTPWL